MRALIVDDEPIARALLTRLLEEHGGVRVVGECGSGPEALEAIRRERLDVVLLDVEMPAMGGVDVVRQLPCSGRPAIIFVTAYDHYAVDAFGVRAVDYLLKPVEPRRLAEALSRVAAPGLRRGPGAPLQGSSLDTSAAGSAERGPHDRESPGAGERTAGPWLVTRRGGERVPLLWDEVVWLESAGNYVRVHATGRASLIRSTMTELETRLAGLPFARIHRTALVNVTRIVSMSPVGHGDYRVRVAGGTELPLSRRYRARVEEILGRLG